MMINQNYSEIITRAKSQGASQADFTNSNKAPIDNSSNKDTLTLSSQALAMSNGENNIVQEVAPIYVRPQTAAELLAEHKSSQEIPSSSANSDVKSEAVNHSRFEDMMQAILDKRLGVDRKKLAELDAMMEEIAKNENLSPEEKAKAMEEIGKMREKIIEESIEIKKIAKENFVDPNEEA
ncbi:MAG: hypothetical protein HRT53_00970 [Colwellia sp.]|nr:hypothetical protein [Colwellia sp.]